MTGEQAITPDPTLMPPQPAPIPEPGQAPAPPKRTFKEKMWRFIDILEIFFRYGGGALRGIKEARLEIQEEAQYEPLDATQAAGRLGPGELQ